MLGVTSISLQNVMVMKRKLITNDAHCELPGPEGRKNLMCNIVVRGDRMFIDEHTVYDKLYSIAEILTEILLVLAGVVLFIGSALGRSEPWNSIAVFLFFLWACSAVIWVLMTLSKWLGVIMGHGNDSIIGANKYFHLEVAMTQIVDGIEKAKNGKIGNMTLKNGNVFISIHLDKTEIDKIIKYYNRHQIKEK